MSVEERRLAAIMFSDICGFSRIMEFDESQALSFVALHLEAVKSGAEEYGGRIIKEMGDGLLAEFSSAVNAVKAALAVQEAINSYNDGIAESEKLFIRIGIHLGDVVVAGDDILGDGVNVASRIEPLAEPGGICISRDIFDLVHNKISIQAVHLGAKELKNISKQIDIYKVLIDAVAAESVTAPLPTVAATKPYRPRRGMGPLAIAGIVVGALILLLGAAMLRKAQFERQAATAFQRVNQRADEFMEKGTPGGAVKVLESYPSRFSKTEFQQKIDDRLRAVRVDVSKDRIRKRSLEMFGSIQNEDWSRAVSFVNPHQVKELGDRNIENRFKLVSVVAKLGKITKDKVRVSRVDISEDGKSADVELEVNASGQWRKTKQPAQWVLIDGEWYSSMGQGPGSEQRQGSGQRPKPGLGQRPGPPRRGSRRK